MRLIIVCLLLFMLPCFSIMYVVSPWLDVEYGVERKLRAKDFHQAQQVCEQVLALRPALLRARANARLGEIAVTAAEAELQKPVPDFSAAQAWLVALLKRNGGLTGSEDRAAHLLKELPNKHYNYARQMFQSGDYEHALHEFEEIGRIYPNDPVQERLKTEAHIAEVETARALNKIGDPEAALDRLAKLRFATHLPPVMVQDALRDVPELAERAIRGHIRQGNVTTAFTLMEELNSRFTDPELVIRLADIWARIDLDLFNVALATGLRGKAPQTPARPVSADRSERAVVRLKNETGEPMILVYVGPQRVEVELPAYGERTFELMPGRYLTGVCWPTKSGIRPSRHEEVLQVGLHTKVFELSPQPLGSALASGSAPMPTAYD
jgi:tetratricopeptide (TPR) repeat protein